MRASSSQSQRLFSKIPSRVNGFLYDAAITATSAPTSTGFLITTTSLSLPAAISPIPLHVALARQKCRLSLNDSHESDEENSSNDHDDVSIQITKLARNSRRIHARIAVRATLHTIWNILTDYERLAQFIPALLLSRLLEKRQNFARLLQIGQQSLAFGLKFNAKGVLDCYEMDLEHLHFGVKRDIEFKMIEGDFELFQGKWSIQQLSENSRENDAFGGGEIQTTLSYLADVTPKPWLPVGLVEGIICREIKMNLTCIREEAEKAKEDTLHVEQ